jgi:hypothetical protein
MKKAEKLPKWAQYEIMKLEKILKSLQEKVDSASSDNTNMQWNNGLDTQKHGLPDNSKITFLLPSGRIEISIHEGALRVYSQDLLVIKPSAANAATLENGK